MRLRSDAINAVLNKSILIAFETSDTLVRTMKYKPLTGEFYVKILLHNSLKGCQDIVTEDKQEALDMYNNSEYCTSKL